jgi:hypothetical protein
MPITKISANATTQVKNGPGKLRGIFVSSPGSAWTLAVNDGPTPGGAVSPMMGATPFTVPAAGTTLPLFPMNFSIGLQVVTAGTTPGEIEVEWDED